MTSPMYGFYALEADEPRIEHNVAVNVSDLFVARYIRHGMEIDPLRVRSLETGHAVYNRGLMSEEEWAESEVYRNAYSLHGMLHVLEVPITEGRQVFGALHCGSSERDYAATDLRLAEVVADIVAISIKSIRSQHDRESALEQSLVALELAGTALVVSEPRAVDLRLNPAALRLVAEVANGEECLPPLLAPRSEGGRFSRRAEVELRTGETALLHAHSQPLSEGGLVTVLELQRDHPLLDHSRLVSLTPRDSEVAMLIIEGLSDREIAEQLCLSRYTVHQYVKRIYRKLDVDSRVALTRLLLGLPVGARRS
jgi:DNA-binding CsgD family transcriptional regulator